jgi:hypothetical protein
MQTTSQPGKVTTGTGLKTLLQFVMKAGQMARIIEWGISFDGSAAATPGTVELIETDVGATITQSVAADITKVDGDALNNGDPTTAIVDVSSTTKTGYTASSEGSTTAVRNLDAPQLIAPTNQFVKQFPLGQEPILQAAKFGRIRVQFGTAINALCYVKIQV